MTYIPHTDADRAAMLDAIGVGSMDELFDRVPESLRFPPLNLPDGLSELEVAAELRGLPKESALERAVAEAISLRAAELAASLQRSGQPIGLIDTLSQNRAGRE